ncbi:MAG: fold metallo-hydrolase [Parcubacteria group bacterium]|nr:fold metallo-hydrolase [Parcubacteria group bacterium]
MKITKYAHACLLIEEAGVRLITDPGSWNETPTATGVHAILITHEHQDHCDVAQVKEILARNPDAVVITHTAVVPLLAAVDVAAVVIEEGQTVDVSGVSVESFGHDHAIIYGDTSPCRNTGFLIAGKLFVPGDALHDVPNRAVDILALPTGGPWMKIAEAIDYAKAVKPRIAFPIHDAMYGEDYKRGFAPRIMGGALETAGIAFQDLVEGETAEF